MASVGLVTGHLRGVSLLMRATTPLLATAAPQSLQQKRTIISKVLREPGYQRPAPFPYQEKKYTFWRALLDDTTQRFDENSKIVVVDGPPTGHKAMFAKQVAEELDMHYVPAAHLDAIYCNSYGDDLRKLNDQLPEVFKSFDVEDFLRNPNHAGATRMQFFMMKIRFIQYQQAISHLLNTGQGVVMHRCIYSDAVFMNTLVDSGFVTENARSFYKECLESGMVEFLRPHLVIYLDIPVDQILANVKARKNPVEINSKFFTAPVLNSLENNYKNYLRDIGTHAEVLVYDWSEEGEAEVVVEDICRINFDKYTHYDKKLADWIFRDEWEWKAKRIMFSDHAHKMRCWLEIPRLSVPELVASGEEIIKFHTIADKSPGNRYAHGFNKDVGDNYLFKL